MSRLPLSKLEGVNTLKGEVAGVQHPGQLTVWTSSQEFLLTALAFLRTVVVLRLPRQIREAKLDKDVQWKHLAQRQHSLQDLGGEYWHPRESKPLLRISKTGSFASHPPVGP